nr:myb-related protein 305-like [Ipomoea batatas]
MEAFSPPLFTGPGDYFIDYDQVGEGNTSMDDFSVDSSLWSMDEIWSKSNIVGIPKTISSQIDRLRLSPMSSSFGTIDNICNPLNAAAPIGDDGEEGADDWVSSGIYVEFGGKGFLRVFMKLMMKMTSNGNGMKVVKRINGEIIEIFAIFSQLLSAVQCMNTFISLCLFHFLS